MTQYDKYELQSKTKLKYQAQRFILGINKVIHNKLNALEAILYIVLSIFVIIIINEKYSGLSQGFINNISSFVYKSFTPLYIVAGFIVLMVRIGTPKGAKYINENLWRIGLLNHVAEAPLILKKYRMDKKSNVIIMEFEANGISVSEWEDAKEQVETALNVYIIKIEAGKNRNRVILHTVSGSYNLNDTIYWRDEYLCEDDFSLTLGNSLIGIESINLSNIPHILIGGSTGSGKSILLKSLVMQCVKKKAIVYIADFKGGVDFPPIWHSKCSIITDEADLLDVLTKLTEELEKRKILLRSNGCDNISSYNSTCEDKLKRIIFACDEIAEILDKTGLSKESKEAVGKIENKLSTIARQGRAFGIHLILATQRPDANILTGQIRNNIDCRICGRADNVLSQIILDSAEAADKIPKYSRGLFVTNEGTVFRGYLFDEGNIFDE